MGCSLQLSLWLLLLLLQPQLNTILILPAIKFFPRKWVHESTFAFTQIGCKYAYEMPTDSETQQLLGQIDGNEL
jgi:hypothetical protein